MAKRVGVDKWLFGVTVLLVFIGLLMGFSASAVMAEDRYGSPYTFVSKQVGWAVLGLITMIVMMRIDYRKFNRPTVVLHDQTHETCGDKASPAQTFCHPVTP